MDGTLVFWVLVHTLLLHQEIALEMAVSAIIKCLAESPPFLTPWGERWEMHIPWGSRELTLGGKRSDSGAQSGMMRAVINIVP